MRAPWLIAAMLLVTVAVGDTFVALCEGPATLPTGASYLTDGDVTINSSGDVCFSPTYHPEAGACYGPAADTTVSCGPTGDFGFGCSIGDKITCRSGTDAIKKLCSKGVFASCSTQNVE
jgi:hypothetical protein